MFVVNNLIFRGDLTQYGIRPRHISSLPGIIWSPFLHTSFRHLSANTIPLLVLGAIICVRSKREFAAVTTGGILLGGGLTWLLARGAYHVGASGLIFCFFGYLASLAYFNRNIPTLLLSLVCIVGYGGILRGIVPTSAAVSWEGHLAGFLSGIAMAWGISTSKKTRFVDANGPATVLPRSSNIPAVEDP
jgi:membrane associated rhomboid family serine protease